MCCGLGIGFLPGITSGPLPGRGSGSGAGNLGSGSGLGNDGSLGRMAGRESCTEVLIRSPPSQAHAHGIMAEERQQALVPAYRSLLRCSSA